MKTADEPAAIIDLSGASGASYRFRKMDRPDSLPASGGNFVCTTGQGAQLTLVCAGTASNLGQARETCATALSQHGATELYTRLNVTAAVREAEHLDIVALHPPTWTVWPN